MPLASLVALWTAAEAGVRLEKEKKVSISDIIADTKCRRCGSTEHATDDCPHGILDTKCAKCGSTEHATEDCPQGILDSKCTNCGSTEHATDDCPHGILDSKCAKCGSTEHATNDCPHGILDTKCAHCGSKDHSTEQCPHLNQRIPDSDADAADAADAADNGSLWEKIQDKALFIGAAIGAILGLINAFESATDIVWTHEGQVQQHDLEVLP